MWCTHARIFYYDPNIEQDAKISTYFYICFKKSIYSEKATNFCEISTVDLSYVVIVKSRVEISQNFVAFSEYTYEL